MRPLTLSKEQFLRLAESITSLSAEYLEKLPQVRTFPADASGEGVARRFGGEVPREGMGEAAFEDLAEVLAYGRPNSPRFFGYVFGSGLPVGALGDYLAGVANQNVTAWRSSPSAVTIERTTVGWLAEAVGCGGFSGSLTGGGSMANLMGLCMAREAKCPANRNGVRGGTIYCSSEAHMSIPKAAMLLGLGEENVRRIPVDEAFRMRVDGLREALRKDVAAGLRPIAVVPTAGTVATGSIDPLVEIAEICREYGVWMHVDGAYGALAALAAPEKFAGLKLADSLSLDPHKWLYQPAGCGCLLFRDPADAQRAFSHSGDYARVLSDDPIEGFAFFEESMELSRPSRALKVWLSLRYYGLRAFQDSIAQDLRLAQKLGEAIRAEAELELLAPIELSAVCFRVVKAGADLNALNKAVLQRVVQRGKVYLSNATVGDKFALRACIVNHRTTDEDVVAVVSEVLAAAGEVGSAT